MDQPGKAPSEHPHDDLAAAPSSATAKTPAVTPTAAGDDVFDQARRQKMAKLKQAIDQGAYHVSSEEVARKLIEHMMQRKK